MQFSVCKDCNIEKQNKQKPPFFFVNSIPHPRAKKEKVINESNSEFQLKFIAFILAEIWNNLCKN